MKQPPKRPRDTNQRAWQIVRETTRQPYSPTPSNPKDTTAKKTPPKPSKD